VAAAPVAAPAPVAAVDTGVDDESASGKKKTFGVEVMLALPKDSAETFVRSSPGLRIHGYIPLRDRVGFTASVNYIRGLNQSDVSSMVATDVYGVSAGARLVLSKSDSHAVFAEGLIDIEHLSVTVDGSDGTSGTGFGLRFDLGAEVVVSDKWTATASLGYSSTGVDVDMGGETTTLGLDFVVLGMGAETKF
jgi:hypothetical protein